MVSLPSLAFRSLPTGDTVILWLGGGGGGGGGELELEVSSITFCFVLALLTAYLFCIGLFRMYVLANSRQCSFCSVYALAFS